MSTETTGIESFRTPRMSAQRLCADHFEELCGLYADERVMATLGGVRTPDVTQTYLEAVIQHWEDHGFGFWIFHDTANGEFAGRGGLRRLEIEGTREVEVAYAVVADRWGQGFATEMAEAAVEAAFRRLKLASLVAFTLPSNKASSRVMEKVGFSYEREIVYADLPHVLYRLTTEA